MIAASLRREAFAPPRPAIPRRRFAALATAVFMALSIPLPGLAEDVPTADQWNAWKDIEDAKLKIMQDQMNRALAAFPSSTTTTPNSGAYSTTGDLIRDMAQPRSLASGCGLVMQAT
jgi:hypothetical protein